MTFVCCFHVIIGTQFTLIQYIMPFATLLVPVCLGHRKLSVWFWFCGWFRKWTYDNYWHYFCRVPSRCRLDALTEQLNSLSSSWYWSSWLSELVTMSSPRSFISLRQDAVVVVVGVGPSMLKKWWTKMMTMKNRLRKNSIRKWVKWAWKVAMPLQGRWRRSN